MDQDVLTEVPSDMKQLIRLVCRGFYTIEHSLVIDLLVRHPCMKEDDMLELLKFDRKQLRAVTNTLKNDKFIKVRMRVETDSEGKMTRHNYYFISYIMFVNVVKYKLDHMRKKIDQDERDNTSRASFKCEECQKSFTDLEADQLFDFMTQTFRCTLCDSEVQEDESAVNKKDARTSIAKFNEQIEPLYDLLRKCEDVRLAPELMEPEPTDIKSSRTRNAKPAQEGERTTWSGDATKYRPMFGYTEGTITVSMNSEEKKETEAPKEQPLWMKESTVDGIVAEKNIDVVENDAGGDTKKEPTVKSDMNREIESLLMIHEKKSSASLAVLTGNVDAEDSPDSSDSEAETASKPLPATDAGVAEMESEEEEEEEEVTVMVGGVKVPLSAVTDEMAARMTMAEKAEYIRLGQEMHHMYE